MLLKLNLYFLSGPSSILKTSEIQSNNVVTSTYLRRINFVFKQVIVHSVRLANFRINIISFLFFLKTFKNLFFFFKALNFNKALFLDLNFKQASTLTSIVRGLNSFKCNKRISLKKIIFYSFFSKNKKKHFKKVVSEFDFIFLFFNINSKLKNFFFIKNDFKKITFLDYNYRTEQHFIFLPVICSLEASIFFYYYFILFLI